jgi:hypothetical protein
MKAAVRPMEKWEGNLGDPGLWKMAMGGTMKQPGRWALQLRFGNCGPSLRQRSSRNSRAHVL